MIYLTKRIKYEMTISILSLTVVILDLIAIKIKQIKRMEMKRFIKCRNAHNFVKK